MKKLLIIFFFLLLIGFLPSKIFAVDCNDPIIKNDPKYKIDCTFGTIAPPPPLANLLKNDPTGAGAISTFLSNFVALIFTLAAVVLILMLLWGAFEWMISEGDKEKLAAAQRKIINAIIGIILFAVAFAIIRLLGTFTGFTFFEGQNFTVTHRDSQRNITGIKCRNGIEIYSTDIIKNPEARCQ